MALYFQEINLICLKYDPGALGTTTELLTPVNQSQSKVDKTTQQMVDISDIYLSLAK